MKAESHDNGQNLVSRFLESPNTMVLLNQYAEYLRGILVVSEEDFRVWQDFLEEKYGISPVMEVE